MKIRSTSTALRDYQQATKCLHDQSPAAARMFVAAVDNAFQTLRDNPHVGRDIGYRSVRALVLIKFPYKLFYRISHGEIEILRLFHMSQDPRKAPGSAP